jgi:hypothetical protein
LSVFGTLSDCIESALIGHVVWDPGVWG